MKAFVIAIAAICAPLAAVAAGDQAGISMVVRQSGNAVESISIAYGAGSNVQFFSNVDASGMDWDREGQGYRSGTIKGNAPVVLGVCAGGKCSVSGDLSFESKLGDN